eukprot:TRINITY_DN5103_c0_g2_i13.p2 TRINITY_DN5103_c0_g2~~TRINITY_DN5103_c0_g2_i13.p2  ORF type:complete len:105 (+),score=7.39 TRINITY_DN5103_c0_g2_i13:570-884(+)
MKCYFVEVSLLAAAWLCAFLIASVFSNATPLSYSVAQGVTFGSIFSANSLYFFKSSPTSTFFCLRSIEVRAWETQGSSVIWFMKKTCGAYTSSAIYSGSFFFHV